MRRYLKIIQTHQITIYPNSTMRKVIKDNFNYSRYIYNKALGTWNRLYQEYQKDPSAPKPNHYLVRNTLVANKENWELGLSSRVLQSSVKKVDKAFKNFWNPNMPNHKKPKFKRKKMNHSFNPIQQTV